ncbi:MAG: transposase [Candidatus Goldbacteria bacterium]|nr:transposase [Candidatus Goldiibacteriota bacterium]
MTQFMKNVIIKKWLPLMEEYEMVKNKKSEHFRWVYDLVKAYHVNKKDLYKYYKRWIESRKNVESLLPQKRGPRYKSRRTLKPIERNIMKAYRKLGSPSYELVLMFKPYYLEKTPSSRTIDRIKARYPLNEKQKKEIKRYEKRYPGELGHIDSYYLPTELAMPRQYLVALEDDCTRLVYAEVVENIKALTISFFTQRALSWFKHVYGFHYDKIMSDNGVEFKGLGDHPLEYTLKSLGIEHIYTPPYYPQPNGKVEAFFKIIQTEYIRSNYFKDIKEFKDCLEEYIYNYNHLRRHGGIK